MTRFGSTELATLLATLARTGALLSTAPLLGNRSMPVKVRASLALLISAAVFSVRQPVEPAHLPLTLVGEILLGLVAGFSARLILLGIETGGQLIGLSVGLGFAGVFDPLLGDQALPTRRITYALVSIAFLLAGGFEAVVRVIAQAPVDGRSLLRSVVTIIGGGHDVLVAALGLAAPVLLAAIVANVAVALASRAAPALNVFSVMLAFIVSLGGLALLITAPSYAQELMSAGRRAADTMLQVAMP